jgi:aminomethyltransferase
MSPRLPLHEVHLDDGATIADTGGWEVPRSYGDPAAEYEAVRHRVGVIDRGDRGVLEVTGRDRASFLHAMLSNDITGLGSGSGCAATLLDVHGKVQVIVVVLALDERILVLTPADMAPTLSEALDKYLFSEKAFFRDATGELSLVMLAGPSATAVAERLAATQAPGTPWSHVAASLSGVEVRLVRGGGETGSPEIWLLGGAADGGRLWRMAREAGARPVGLTALESLRIEAGTPRYGVDVDASVLLPEIPFADLVSHSKGCYLGQEVVVRIRDRGHVNRHLRGLVLDGDTVPEPDAAVMAGDTRIGHVTSATWSLGLARPIALAFVRRQHAEAGTAVTVQVGDRVIPATVSALPISR